MIDDNGFIDFLETWRRTIEMKDFKGWNDETTITKLYWLLACWFIHLNREIKKRRGLLCEFYSNGKNISRVKSNLLCMEYILSNVNLVYAGRRINLNVQKDLFILFFASNFNCSQTLRIWLHCFILNSIAKKCAISWAKELTSAIYSNLKKNSRKNMRVRVTYCFWISKQNKFYF